MLRQRGSIPTTVDCAATNSGTFDPRVRTVAIDIPEDLDGIPVSVDVAMDAQGATREEVVQGAEVSEWSPAEWCVTCLRSTPSSRTLAAVTWNRLIEGDNLDVLPTLAAAGEQFDLIYIDPPYNTGSTFVYVDDRRGIDGRRAGRHEAWTEMMRPRLEAARAVMSPGAAIFVSIDDNEAAWLRILMDSVFGERNFLAQIVVNLNPKGRQLGGGFALNHEYLLCYAADASACVLQPSSAAAVSAADFPHTAPDGRRYRLLPLRNTNKKFNPATAPTLHFAIFGDPVTGRVATAPFEGAVEIKPVFGDGMPAVWRWSAPLIQARPDDLVCRVVACGWANASTSTNSTGRTGPPRGLAARNCAPSGPPTRSGPPTLPSPRSGP